MLIGLTLATPALANRSPDRDAIGNYVRARLSDAAGASVEASRNYAAALADRPDDGALAGRAYRQAMLSGDTALALRAAAVLDKAGVLPADGRLLFLVRDVGNEDWASAGRAIDRVESDGNFDFLVPMLRAWVALGAGSDGVAVLDAAPTSALGAAYRPEQRALLLFAAGRTDEGLTAAQAIMATGGPRALDLRLSAAATLAKRGRKDDALTLLAGEAPLFVRARAMVAAGTPPVTPIGGAASGIGRLFQRLAADINGDRPSPLALSLGWLALALMPDDDATLLVTAQMLAAGGHVDESLALVDRMAVDGAYGIQRGEVRVALLVRNGANAQALQAAYTAGSRKDATLSELVRLGDVYSALDRHRDAADAYGRAIGYADANPTATRMAWSLYLLRGGALERAGDWTAALPMLEKAAALAPEDATVLNYLGYAQLERRQNVAKAAALIKRAAELKPDDPAIADSLGWAYFLRGDTPRAIVSLERAVAGEPSDPTINEHLGDAYWTAGRRYEARYAWRAAALTAEAADVARIAAKLEGGLTAAHAAR